MGKVALVAGASSGLGRAIAEKLAADGFITYAGGRSFQRGKEPPKGCHPIPLDVTDDASIAAAVAAILQAEGHIHALINCAGILTLGSLEDLSLDELSAVMETNYFGMIRMTKALLPTMRAQGGGRIFQLSSLNGLFAIPFQGAYTASKHAIEGFSKALALETRPFGITVTLVCPGDCSGGSDAYRRHGEKAENPASPYYAHYRAATARIHRDETGGLPPERVAAAVSRALAAKRPPARIVVAKADQRLAMCLHDALPGRLFQRIIHTYYKPKEHTP